MSWFGGGGRVSLDDARSPSLPSSSTHAVPIDPPMDDDEFSPLVFSGGGRGPVGVTPSHTGGLFGVWTDNDELYPSTTGQNTAGMKFNIKIDATEIREQLPDPERPNLNQFLATAICGNDITASVLYVTGLVTISAGKYAPVCLAMVAATLYLYRSIYSEVGSALPFNGGAYNLLLNTTTKLNAAAVASVAVTSYVATGVVSATSAMHYLRQDYDGLSVFWSSIAVLFVFAVLSVWGMVESSFSALVIFSVHLVVMTIFIISGTIGLFEQGWQYWGKNMLLPAPQGEFWALFFGFSTALIGITGFETSSNYIEQQAPGVYPKTLRNVWFIVAFLNPFTACMALGSMPIQKMDESRDHILSDVAMQTMGDWLRVIVDMDAVIVLCGSVITSYVGVTGLVRRMAEDGIFPEILMRRNNFRGTNHYIIFGFFTVCMSLIVVTDGEMRIMSGFYTMAFALVMIFTAIGALLLKKRRPNLPRGHSAAIGTIMAGMAALIIGATGRALQEPFTFILFFLYSLFVFCIVYISLDVVPILRRLLLVCRFVLPATGGAQICTAIVRTIDEIRFQKLAFFANRESLEELSQVCDYVTNNEQGRWLKIIHVYEIEGDIPPLLESNIAELRQMFNNLRIDLVTVNARFGREVIDRLSMEMNIKRNFMFMGCPGRHFRIKLSVLGGLRIILP